MPVIDDMLADDFMCSCGRQLKVFHCTKCGSTALRALRRDRVYLKNESGTTTVDRRWVCQRCGHKFYDSDRLSCTASKATISAKAQLAVNGVTNLVKTKLANLSPAERKNYLAGLFSTETKDELKFSSGDKPRVVQGPNDEVGLTSATESELREEHEKKG